MTNYASPFVLGGFKPENDISTKSRIDKFTDLPKIYGDDLGGSVVLDASSEGIEPIARCVIWNEVSA